MSAHWVCDHCGANLGNGTAPIPHGCTGTLPELTPEESAACERHGSYTQYLESDALGNRVQEIKALKAELVDMQVNLNFAVERFQKAEANLARVTEQLKAAREALEKLGNWRTPAVLGEGDYDRGLLCGVEDLDLQSLGYEAMRYGYDCAIERVGEEIDETIRAALAKPEQEGGE